MIDNNLPSFIDPSSNKNDIITQNMKFVKSVYAGSAIVKFSESTLMILKASQSKQYVINEIFLNLLTRLNESGDLSINLPFPTNLQINLKKKELDHIETSLCGTDRFKILDRLLKIIKKKNPAVDFKSIYIILKKKLNITYTEFNLYKKYLQTKEDFYVMLEKKRQF